MAEHEHEFHAFSEHFGQYGPQDVHTHPCDCGDIMVGDGRECRGAQAQRHAVYRYSDRSGWVPARRGKVIAAMQAAPR